MFDGPVALFAQAMEQPRRPPRCSRASRLSSTLIDDDAAVVRRHRAAAAPVPRRRWSRTTAKREIKPRRLAVSALSRADQPVRGADRDRRPAHVLRPAASTATCSCWRCRCAAGPNMLDARRLRRRPVGRDRDGDRRIGRARRSWCRTTSSCRWCCSGARRCSSRPRRCRRAAADGAAHRDLRASCCSPTSITARPATRSSPRSACSPSPPSRSSRRPSSAA